MSRTALSSRSKVIIALIGAAVAVVAIWSVVRSAGDPTARPSSTPAVTTSASANKPDSCTTYLKLSDAEREAAFADEKPLTLYTDQGAREGSVVEAYDYYCESDQGKENTGIVNGMVSGLASADCGRYLTLDPQSQTSWVEALQNEQYFPTSEFPTDPAAFARGCLGFAVPSGSAIRMANTVKGAVGFDSWMSASRLGYQTGIGVAVYPPQTGEEVVHPYSDSLTVDGTCDYNPATDAVIPYVLRANDETEGFDAARDLYAAMHFEFVGDPGTSTTQGVLEAQFSDGNQCFDAAGQDSSGDNSDLRVTFNAPDSGWGTNAGFIILHNWVSPRFPNGATSELGDYRLVSLQPTGSDDDPVVETTRGGIALNGSPFPG